MLAVSEIAKLKRDVETLSAIVRQDRGAGGALAEKQRRALKSEIEWCIQELDELRTRLTG